MSDDNLVQAILLPTYSVPEKVHYIIMETITDMDVDMADIDKVEPIYKILADFYDKVS